MKKTSKDRYIVGCRLCGKKRLAVEDNLTFTCSCGTRVLVSSNGINCTIGAGYRSIYFKRLGKRKPYQDRSRKIV